MARRFVRPVVRQGAKRQSAWFENPPGVTTIAAASTAVLVGSLNAAALAMRPFTIIRTRGSLFYKSDQSAANERYGCGYGLAVVSDEAVAIGVTAIPTPITDQGSDLWFLLEQLEGFFGFADATGFAEVGQERMIDSKAMRKVDIGQDLVIVAETAAFHPSCLLTDSFRFLVKLH